MNYRNVCLAGDFLVVFSLATCLESYSKNEIVILQRATNKTIVVQCAVDIAHNPDAAVNENA